MSQQIYIFSFTQMEFTSINQYESFIDHYIKHSNPPENLLSSFDFERESIDQQEIQDVLQNIDSMDMAHSLYTSNLHDKDDTLETLRNKEKHQNSSPESFEKVDPNSFNSEKKNKSYAKNKSLIFSSSPFLRTKTMSPLPSKEQTIKVYFFNFPTSKEIYYNKNTKVKDIIESALQAYSQDSQLDQVKITNFNYPNYELRLLENEESHQADMTVESLSHDRYISELCIDVFVLVMKSTEESKLKKMTEERKLKKIQPIEYIKNPRKNSVEIFILNQFSDQLESINLDKNQSLERLFQYIETKDMNHMRNFYLSESRYDDYNLPRDFQVKNLESNKIYLKTKRFIDDSEYQQHRKTLPIRSASITLKQKQSHLKMPIGITEASKYEEFEIIKINSSGKEQERVLGIDQIKIYNYEKSVRKEKKQISFFSKIFGADSLTGTKKPYRFIKDIQLVTKTQKGFSLKFDDKTIHYLTANEEVQEKILRKLMFLIDYIKVEQKKGSQKFLKN